jgi:hypothetical protein
VNTRPAGVSRRGWPLPQTGPVLWKTKGLCPRTQWVCPRGIPIRFSRCRCHPGAQGPVAEEQKAIRAWLPAPLVWTWVRAYRQLHAGNAGLRPATTSFPFALLYRLCVKLDAAFSSGEAVPTSVSALYAEAVGCAHAGNAPCSKSSCQSKRRKLHCRFLDNVPETMQSGTTAQRRRISESAHAFCSCVSQKIAHIQPCMTFHAPAIVETM